LISDAVHEKKLELAGENGIKTVYDLQSYWTSMAAILDSLGFTFLIDRMTEVLTPDIYIELTAVNCLRPVNSIYIYIWNDNIQSFDCENNEASIPVFHADWTSVSVPFSSPEPFSLGHSLKIRLWFTRPNGKI
jgi:hypothetical protein